MISRSEEYEVEKFIKQYDERQKKLADYQKLSCSECEESYTFIVMDVTEYPIKKISRKEKFGLQEVELNYAHRVMGDTIRLCDKHYLVWRKHSQEIERQAYKNFFI
jgi:hypothetical protein